MNSTHFQLNKVRRLINTDGVEFTFTRPGRNEFNEPTGTTESIKIKGVYHETTSYISKMSSDSSTVRQKPSPMILALWSEAEVLQHTDVLDYNGKSYKINGIKNVAEANIVADLSLEEIQHEV